MAAFQPLLRSLMMGALVGVLLMGGFIPSTQVQGIGSAHLQLVHHHADWAEGAWMPIPMPAPFTDEEAACCHGEQSFCLSALNHFLQPQNIGLAPALDWVCPLPSLKPTYTSVIGLVPTPPPRA